MADFKSGPCLRINGFRAMRQAKRISLGAIEKLMVKRVSNAPHPAVRVVLSGRTEAPAI